MPRRHKALQGYTLPPLNEWWGSINAYNRSRDAEERAKHKARDKRRKPCCCAAFKFPHRPGSGACRYPEPPLKTWKEVQQAEIDWRVAEYRRRWGEPDEPTMADLVALTTKSTRPYRRRYTGTIRQICRANGLHPIRDKALIAKVVPMVVTLVKEMKATKPKLRFRNIEIERDGENLSVRGTLPGAYPEFGLRNFPPTRREMREAESNA